MAQHGCNYMRILPFVLLFTALTLRAANPSFGDFTTNQFGVAGNKVQIKSGASLTNVNMIGSVTLGGTSISNWNTGVIEASFNSNGTNSIWAQCQNKWFEYELIYTTNSSITANSWGLDRMWSVDRTSAYTYTKTMGIVTNGSWTFAVFVNGAASFVGGPHGYEFVTNAFVSWDGGVIALPVATTTNITTRRLSLMQSAGVYEFATSTKLAEHSWVMEWTADRLRVNQWIEWASNKTLDDAYMTMLPIARNMGAVQITDRAIISPYYIVKDVSAINFPANSERQGNDVTMWGLTSGIVARVVVTKWPATDPTKRAAFIIHNDATYNKIYFDVAGVGLNVIAGEIWDCSAEYYFQRN